MGRVALGSINQSGLGWTGPGRATVNPTFDRKLRRRGNDDCRDRGAARGEGGDSPDPSVRPAEPRDHRTDQQQQDSDTEIDTVIAAAFSNSRRPGSELHL